MAEQEATVPPYWPPQLQVKPPVPPALFTAEAVPVEQRLEVGGTENEPPFAEPHTPSTAVVVPVVNSLKT